MRPGRSLVITALIGCLALLLLGGGALADFIAELLWYRSIEYEPVFWTRWRAALLVRGTVALLVTAIVYGNLWIVSRSLGAIRVRRRYGNIEIAERLPQAYVVIALLLISLFSAWWLSGAVADPLPILAALDPAPWGVPDPIFGKDASFYVFRLPVLNRFQTLGGLLVFWIGLLSVIAYLATGAVKATESRPVIAPLARRHLGLLLAIFLVVYAFSIWLNRYGLVVSGNGFGGALGYTDLHARIPARTLTFALTLLTAGAIAYGSWIGRGRLPLVAGVLFVLALIGAEAIYPSWIQRFVVEPNQFPREAPFIEDHLEFTRRAYRLRELEREPLPYQSRPEVDEATLTRDLAGLPLWDPRPLLTTFRQQQALFRYYAFASVHTDRYGPEGAEQPIAIAVRELETSELEEAAQTWQNLHLNYVSGEGAVVTPTATMEADGTPAFYVWDLDPPKLAPDAPPELALTEPEIFFGERTRDYVILGPEARATGIELDSGWRKLLFAWAFQSKNLLLSREITPESKIVYRRRVAERLQAVAPFLRISPERGHYPVVLDGRIVWIVDAYTTSATFPLSPLTGFENRGVRYIRNSVKATVDAVTGEVRLYRVDAEDPILTSYERIFAGLVRPIEEMPAELREHLRYPVPLMQLQAQVLGAYHLQDPQAFYAQQDVWSIASVQVRGTPATMEPTYAIYPLPGADQAEFLLSVPFVSRGRQNMTALMVTRNDPPHYGEQRLYLLPRDELIPGPQQIEAMVDQDPEISQQLALWRRGGSDVVRGNLMVVPIGGSLIYLEPLFLEAENAAIPQLERVLLARAGRVVMEPTLASAAAALLGAAPARAGTASGSPEPQQEAALPNADPGAVLRARRLLDQAEALLRAGDWAGFGRALQALREELDRNAGAP